MRNVQKAMRRGFSLIELSIVVLVLAILSGIVVPLLGGLNQISTPTGTKSDKEIITETTMRSIRDAILGSETKPGAWADLGHRPQLFPTDPIQLVAENHPLVGAFDPVTKIGWRGPYLRGSIRQPDGANVFVDGWGNPLTIFVPDTNSNLVMDREDIQYARLVSAGANGKIETLPQNTKDYIPGEMDPATALSLHECGDDIVYFFFVADTRQ
ncbi:MAG: type II secretion system protein [Rubripirellula sp.]|nr:type II secretion system protein [Rubripirellula sp.]